MNPRHFLGLGPLASTSLAWLRPRPGNRRPPLGLESASFSPLRGPSALALAGATALLLGCKKETPPPPPAPAPTPVETATAPVELAPILEDAGVDAGVDAGPPKKAGGGGGNLVSSRAKQCCAALRSQAKALGASPEAGQLQTLATMCDGIAAQLGNAGPQAPELAPLRTLLQGKTLPPLCQGL